MQRFNDPMQSFPSLLRSTIRIMLLRASPERIQVQSWTLPLCLALAAVAYGLVHFYVLSLSGGQVAVSLFCWVMLLSAAMSFVTRYVPRRRLTQVLAAMLLMLALGGLVLTALELVPAQQWVRWLAVPVVAVVLYGMSHALGFALRCHGLLALLWCLLFAAAVYGLYLLLDSQLEQVFAGLVPAASPAADELWLSLRN